MVCTNSMHVSAICTNCTCAFWFARACMPSFACFIGVHSGLPYTRVIHSKPNMCVSTYYYTTESIRTFYKFRAGNVNCYTGGHLKQDNLLSSMATVVDLSKGNTYVSGLVNSCGACLVHHVYLKVNMHP